MTHTLQFGSKLVGNDGTVHKYCTPLASRATTGNKKYCNTRVQYYAVLEFIYSIISDDDLFRQPQE